MAKKKLMSIYDLYNFCLKNKFNHFSYDESNYELCVQMPAKGVFEKEENDKHKEGLRPFSAKAYHDHVNLNKSEIDPDVFKENTKSAPFRPILAHVVKNEETGEFDFGSHDFIIEEDDDGNSKIVYQEQPVGVINGDFSFEYDEDQEVNRAILKGYLYEAYCQDAIDILERRGGTDCSIELNIREMSFNTSNKTLMLDDYYVSGLTMLGENVQPGMKGSNLTLKDFSSENNSILSHAEINEKLINTLDKINDTLSQCFNKTDENQKGGNEMNKFEELLAKYGKTTEDIDFDYSAMTDEELEAKFAELFEDGSDDASTDSASDGNGDGVSEEENEAKFTKTFSVSHEDIRSALYQLIAPFDEEDNAWYGINAVYDDYFIMQDWFSGNLYGCKYSVDGDNISLEGERYKVFAEYLTESEKLALDDMRSNYSAIKDELNKYQKAELDAQKDAIFEDVSYANYLEDEEFKSLMSDKEKYSVEELKDKAEIAFAKCVKKNGTFALNPSESKEKQKINKHVFSKANSKENKKSPYGNIFNKN